MRLTLDADELRRGAPNVETVTHAADLLRTHGVVALSTGTLERGVTGSAAAMATLAADARAHIHILFDAVERFAATPAADAAAAEALYECEFAEVCERGEGRYDFQLELKPFGRWGRMAARARAFAAPICSAACDGDEGGVGDMFSGCVLSMSGAPAQWPHRDGTDDGMFNCFVPLVSLAGSGDGPTEFALGTHIGEPLPPRSVYDVASPEDAATSAGPPRVTSTPLAAGDLVLFDYRVLHRGLANGGSHPRPVFYLALGKPGRADTSNFPATQLADPPLLMEDTVAGDHK